MFKSFVTRLHAGFHSLYLASEILGGNNFSEGPSLLSTTLASK
jgi:hypothetical protein